MKGGGGAQVIEGKTFTEVGKRVIFSGSSELRPPPPHTHTHKVGPRLSKIPEAYRPRSSPE